MKQGLCPNRVVSWSGRLALVGALAVLATIPQSGCNPESNGKKQVVATTGMIADLVRRVGGDTVEVQQIMGPGVDPHLYKPKESAIRRLFRADLIFYNGLHLEGKMVRLLEKNPKAVPVSHDLHDQHPERLLEDEGQHDPHIWFDVSLWLETLDVVERELTRLQPEHAELYHRHAEAYRIELQALHEEVMHALASIPKERRVLVTAHDAFRYFGRAYDVEVVGLQGVSTANEAGLSKVREVVDLIVERKIKAIFVESSVPPDGIKAVQEGCRRRGHEVEIADETLFSDAMDEPGTPGGTYPGMVWHNVRLMVRALK
jgi:manganese/zinc/iron transport system substrate-binding protein